MQALNWRKKLGSASLRITASATHALMTDLEINALRDTAVSDVCTDRGYLQKTIQESIAQNILQI